jgi:hypothetical protein
VVIGIRVLSLATCLWRRMIDSGENHSAAAINARMHVDLVPFIDASQ